MGKNKELDPDSSSGRHGRTSQYMPGLDGLRALAVLAVVLYHLNSRWAPGGLLGVGVFFVLSGYLITDLLVQQWQRGGRIDFRDFWLRRARRLLPAVLFMLAGVVAWVVAFDPSEFASLRGDVLASILYVSNWWFIFHHVSYFASFGPPSPLGHLWSLAVEEQFYLMWPMMLSLCLRFVPHRGWLFGLSIGGAWLSAFAMVLLYQPGTDPSRVYYGTDTRAFALLFGAALAFLWPSRTLVSGVTRRARVWFEVSGVAGLLVVLVMFVHTNEYESFLYPGGLLLASAATALVVAAAAQSGTMGRVLGWKPLRWIGVRSYGIYLWHYPIIVLSTPAVSTGGPDYVRASVQVALSIALAAISWRFVEQPIRHGALTQLWVKLRTGEWRRILPGRWIVSAGVTLVVISVSGMGVVTSVPAASNGPPPRRQDAVTVPTGSKPRTTMHQSGSTVAPKPPHPQGQHVSKGHAVHASLATSKGKGVTAIGDSVMIDASPYLKQLLPGIVVDGKLGRQMYQLPDVLAGLHSKGELGNRVIIELGTNGPFTKNQLVSLIHSLAFAKQIILVNTRVPRPWQDVVNQTLADVSAHSARTTLVDWYRASAGHNGYFYPDGVHLNPEGSQVFATLVAKAVRPVSAK